MSKAEFSATGYYPTLMDHGLLAQRLGRELRVLRTDGKRWFAEFKNHPLSCSLQTVRQLRRRIVQLLTEPNALLALTTAVVLVATVALTVVFFERRGVPIENDSLALDAGEVVFLDKSQIENKFRNSVGTGATGKGRVGINKGAGEGSSAQKLRAQGGGSGGDHDLNPPQTGKVPPPSPVLAAIPKAPPLNPPSLPDAGIDIDPALWKDLKAPVFGDPRSKSEIPSKGPGEGGGMGTHDGLGIGDGSGPGFGSGTNGNTGGGNKQLGCCTGGEGGPGGNDGDPDRVFRTTEVEQKARLLTKPEPHYTEEARRNQTTGTVLLRVVFSSLGEVVQIRAEHGLPFGLTERAIAAARQIKFVPAMRRGRPVSVRMQLEYNFNLY